MVFCDIIMYNTIVVQRIGAVGAESRPFGAVVRTAKERLEVRSRRILESINTSRMEETV